MKTEQLKVNLDIDIKNTAEKVLQELGIDLATAVRILVTKIAREGHFPQELLEFGVAKKQNNTFANYYPDVPDGALFFG